MIGYRYLKIKLITLFTVLFFFFPLVSLLSSQFYCFSKHLLLTLVTTQSDINCFLGLR